MKDKHHKNFNNVDVIDEVVDHIMVKIFCPNFVAVKVKPSVFGNREIVLKPSKPMNFVPHSSNRSRKFLRKTV